MLTSIRLKSHVGADGILKLQVPLESKDVDLEVVVTIEPVLNPGKLGWDPERARVQPCAWITVGRLGNS